MSQINHHTWDYSVYASWVADPVILLGSYDSYDGYYVAYKTITLSCILFMFIEMKFIHCHSCVMFVMKSMSMCNDYMNYDEIIIL